MILVTYYEPKHHSSLYHFALSGWWGLEGGTVCQCLRDLGLIPGLGRSPGAGQPTPVFLPWRIPWTVEPGGLQPIGSQRVRHNWSDLANTHTLVAIDFLLLLVNCCICCCLLLSHVQLFCDSMDCSLPGSAVHGILRARILEWVDISFSRGSS